MIFATLEPFWLQTVKLTNSSLLPPPKRTKWLIALAAIAHDLVQDFLPQTSSNLSRKRESGVSELASIDKVTCYIQILNQQLIRCQPDSQALFSDRDLKIIKAAIEATICSYDCLTHSVYQPYLYGDREQILLPARILALADIGGLGMEGIDSFLREGSLLFLEENPDTIPLIRHYYQQPDDLPVESAAYQSLRQRLLKRSRFQLSFARGRLASFPREVDGLPQEAITALKTEIFSHLNQKTLTQLQAITPQAGGNPPVHLARVFRLPPAPGLRPGKNSTRLALGQLGRSSREAMAIFVTVPSQKAARIVLLGFRIGTSIIHCIHLSSSVTTPLYGTR
ncbi:MAG: hypothetical protein HC890_10705 [Chloroflexaceae bacterium]|nr:hypothetical protein [Chloroflexaceae bacterium]